MLARLFIFLIFISFTSCDQNSQEEFLKDGKAKVLVMMAPDCPLCRNYTVHFKEMIDINGDAIDIYGVIPGTFYSKHEVDSFLIYYDLDMEIIYDPKFKLTRKLKATITPEAYLLDGEGKILYQGLVDNWLGELGRRRQIITEHYLLDAVESYIKGEAIKTPKTKAIGCFIE